MRLATFASPKEFRAWLQSNHATTKALLVRCFKTHAREKGLTYREALDEALCFGWIDGVRRAVNPDSFSVRFTPRKAKSKWSLVNIQRAKELLAKGRMHQAGHAAFTNRDTSNSRRYSFEEKPRRLDGAREQRFRDNKQAWTWFQAQAPWYRRTCIFWVLDAKKEETRERRLAALIECSARGEAVGPMKTGK
jgi:uncharacterized protein YdeI (YjbR/CyaY-like superfamily)